MIALYPFTLCQGHPKVNMASVKGQNLNIRQLWSTGKHTYARNLAMSLCPYNIAVSCDAKKMYLICYVLGKVISRSHENTNSVEIVILAIFGHFDTFDLLLFLY